MTRFSPLSILCILALVVGNGLAANWIWDLTRDDDAALESAASDRPAKPGAQTSPGPLAPRARPLESYAQILARPIFSKTRAPWVAPPPPSAPPSVEAPVQEQAAADPNSFSLRAIVLHRANARVYVVSKDKPNGEWLSKGESIEGWTVETIEPHSAKLRRQGRAIQVKLYGEELQAGETGKTDFKSSDP